MHFALNHAESCTSGGIQRKILAKRTNICDTLNDEKNYSSMCALHVNSLILAGTQTIAQSNDQRKSSDEENELLNCSPRDGTTRIIDECLKQYDAVTGMHIHFERHAFTQQACRHLFRKEEHNYDKRNEHRTSCIST